MIWSIRMTWRVIMTVLLRHKEHGSDFIQRHVLSRMARTKCDAQCLHCLISRRARGDCHLSWANLHKKKVKKTTSSSLATHATSWEKTTSFAAAAAIAATATVAAVAAAEPEGCDLGTGRRWI